MKSCPRCQRVPRLGSPRARIPWGKEGGEVRAGKAQRRKLSWGEKSCFSYLSPKPHFRKITLCCVFSVPLSSVRSRALSLSSGTAKLPGRPSSPGVGLSQSVVAGLGPGRLPPAQLSRAARPRSSCAREKEGAAPLGPSHPRWAAAL